MNLLTPYPVRLILILMNLTNTAQSFFDGVTQMFSEPNAFRSVCIFVAAILAAYWLSHFLAQATVKLAQIIGSRGDKETDDQRNLRYRQVETYLSIAVAIMRVVVVATVGYIAWQIVNPFSATSQSAANGVAAIGAGTFFILFAGQTLGIILRDLTAGAIMITEGWFHVGDYISIEPYNDLSGVVERFTLRSTRLRALNGEIICVNNRDIMGIRVTPRGVRTIAVEIFVRDKNSGEAAVQGVIDAIPKGKTMLAQPLTMEQVEEWADDSWHITVMGQTPPGREWLIENYFFEAIKALDEGKKDEDKLLTNPPMVHMADRTADKRFGRAVRVKKDA